MSKEDRQKHDKEFKKQVDTLSFNMIKYNAFIEKQGGDYAHRLAFDFVVKQIKPQIESIQNHYALSNQTAAAVKNYNKNIYDKLHDLVKMRLPNKGKIEEAGRQRAPKRVAREHNSGSIHIGPRGGKYRIVDGKKVYVGA